jgi:hypothetical protein
MYVLSCISDDKNCDTVAVNITETTTNTIEQLYITLMFPNRTEAHKYYVELALIAPLVLKRYDRKTATSLD